ncbi:hypothetical protein ACO0R3_000763 [Hanseniaspora guilliermondii]
MNTQASIQFKKTKLENMKKQLEKLKMEYSNAIESTVFKQSLPEFKSEQELLDLCKKENKLHIETLRKYNALRDTGIHLLELVAEEKNLHEANKKLLSKMDVLKELGYDSMD